MVGTATALLIAGGAASAGMSVAGGQTQSKNIKKQAEANAQIYEQQAGMVLEKKKISDYQFSRDAGRIRGSIVASAAGKGLFLSGSPAAILADNESQMQFDKAIEDYNLNVERNYALSGAQNTRAQGAMNARAARSAGYMQAFSTLLNTGAQAAMMNYRPSGSASLGSRPYASASPRYGATRI